MSKAGDAYQDAVADVARCLDPSARIEVGAWIEGPDGRRDLDVVLRHATSDRAPFIVIECKDWARPVGIGALDALESKRRDLGAAVAMICSNSGFTADAIRKASRVGIPALSALIEGDSRIRIEVQEEIYTRQITVGRLDSTWHFVVPNVQSQIPSGTTARDLMVEDRLVGAWVRDKAIWLGGLSTRSRRVLAKYRFSRPIPLHVREIVLPANGVDLTIQVTVQWCSQIVGLGASSGMYDHLRKRVMLGAGSTQYLLKNVDPEKWKPIDDVPSHPVALPRPREDEMFVSLATLDGIDACDGAAAPDLDSLIATSEVAEQ